MSYIIISMSKQNYFYIYISSKPFFPCNIPTETIDIFFFIPFISFSIRGQRKVWLCRWLKSRINNHRRAERNNPFSTRENSSASGRRCMTRPLYNLTIITYNPRKQISRPSRICGFELRERVFNPCGMAVTPQFTKCSISIFEQRLAASNRLTRRSSKDDNNGT